MVRNGMTVYEGVKISTIAPKTRTTVKEQRSGGIEFLAQAGIPSPEEFYEELRKAQGYHSKNHITYKELGL